MDISILLDRMDEPTLAVLLGLAVGTIFGVAAQRSSFCLRAATVEFARGQVGPKVAVWLLAFSTALIWVQTAQALGLFRASDARMMAVAGSWSGAAIGGLMFGAGMVLARGCSGRLLVLAATGNLRSVISGLIFAVVAQMALHGWLAPLRQALAALWVTPGGRNVDLLATLSLPPWAGLGIGIAATGVALGIAWRNRIDARVLVFASGVGFAVALGWVLTFSLSQVAFEPVAVTSATFSGPSAATLMFFLTPNPELSFDIGLVPGVFLGAFLAAAWAGELKLQGFEGEGQMRRSMAGAALMGFGAMLAGGCAIGAGVTGGSIFVATAWAALLSMWVGAVLTDFLVDQVGAKVRQ
ncbi:YeeE/YedE family protein [Pseudotabrizicola alkalilacus]|uniref:YeeE/YedE family protein n=1 Tax=Pseudotabrizicola alkalilacus TaxID=2305252 RepID=A0A411Z234_9RHOB|nr:YeeE/YedE family protein [Pseudotabrizicola alkalilacus]RGP37126.1 YeeE/YedE family protein [Pseudotabrizicola alkalilacus]